MRIILISLVFICFGTSSNLLAQKQYFIKDSRTNSSIPFVKVYPSEGEPFLTDLDGMFEVGESIKSIRLKYKGYKDSTVLLNPLSNTLFFEKDIQEVVEVRVIPGENPAHRIMRMAQKNRKQNHPLKNDAFIYKSYSKFVFDVNQKMMIPEDSEDTLTFKLQNYFTDQHLFVMENATRRTFYPPGKDQEEVLAYKVSGISDPSLSTFAQSMQSFNFYDNQFDILGESFINPLASDGIRRYLFILEDTLVHQSDTTFTLFFRPRKGKNFKGLAGRIYINTNGFAVEKVNARAYRPTGEGQFDVTIIQEYAYIANKKWFPVKLSTDLSFGNVVNKNDTIPGVVFGSGHTYVDSIVINPAEKRKGFYDNYNLYTSPDAGELSEEEWQKLRTYDLTKKEIRTHYKVDSISKANNIKKRLDFLKELAKGKIQLGMLSIPIDRLIRYNQYEKLRLGAGLETSSKLSKIFSMGGYFGWGTKDKEWKYGGYSDLKISRKRNTKVQLKFQQDLIERGGQRFTSGVFDLNDTDRLRFFFIEQMERQRLAEFAFSTDIKANMNVRIFTNYQRIDFTEGYEFTPLDNTVFSDPEKVDIAEIGGEFKWNIGERYIFLGESKVSQGLKHPSIRIKAIRGIQGVWESKYDYWRFNASISHKVNVRDYFVLHLHLTATKTIGDVPLFLMHNGKGTKINWMVDVENTFQTMIAGSYYSQEQIAFFSRIKFKSIHTKAKWNEPTLSLHHSLGYGQFKNSTNHQFDFKTMEKGYLEAGMAIDNLYISNKVSGVGIGVFYNYGPTRDPNWKNNIVPKVTFSLGL